MSTEAGAIQLAIDKGDRGANSEHQALRHTGTRNIRSRCRNINRPDGIGVLKKKRELTAVAIEYVPASNGLFREALSHLSLSARFTSISR